MLQIQNQSHNADKGVGVWGRGLKGVTPLWSRPQFLSTYA